MSTIRPKRTRRPEAKPKQMQKPNGHRLRWHLGEGVLTGADAKQLQDTLIVAGRVSGLGVKGTGHIATKRIRQQLDGSRRRLRVRQL